MAGYKNLRALSVGILALFLSGCGEDAVPIAAEYDDFVGIWESGTLGESNSYRFLQITASGYLMQGHWRREGNVTNCLAVNKLPVTTLSETQIHASAYWVINVDLAVDAPPSEVDGSLRMTVEGDPMIKTSDQAEGFDFKWECADDGLTRTPAG